MRLVTYQSPQGPRVAGIRQDAYVDLNHADPTLPSCAKALLALLGPKGNGRQRVAAAVQSGESFSPEDVRLLPPVPNPEKIVCVGVNYADHARETGKPVPDEPVIFNKFPTTISTHLRPVPLPEVSSQVDFEAELVVVIGPGGKNIPAEQAFDHVAAYACGNDVSARDWQLHKPAGQWLLGKSFDGFAPVGPYLVTADEIPEPGNLGITLRLNGQTMQDSRTDQLLFPIDTLIAYISQVCTLTPGDLLYTGTPPGVGFARTPPVFLKPGDEIEVEIERIGILRNPVVAELARVQR